MAVSPRPTPLALRLAAVTGATVLIGAVGVGCSNGNDGSGDPVPSAGASSAPNTPGPSDSVSPMASDSSSPAASSSASSSDQGGKSGKDVDLADHTFSTSAQDAVDKATDKAGKGTLHAIELDWSDSDSAWQWDVKILRGKTDHKVVIDADSGKVVRDETESTNDTEKSIDLNKPMSVKQAQDKALKAQSGRISGWKLEYDDGMKAYQFDIVPKGQQESTEVTVNVDNGRVSKDD